MARKPRFLIPGIPQHIIQRGNNRDPCFFSEQDCYAYLRLLTEAADQYHCAIHAYVLMTNHVHILATPIGPNSISHTMQALGRRYVRTINHTYRRSGTLWEGRYKASLIETETYLLTCYRYIELNPVRANMVTAPGDYAWSSYHHNAFGQESDLIAPHPEYTQLGATAEQRQQAYRELFRHHIDNDTLHDIREATNQELVLGHDRFKDHIEAALQRQTRPGQRGRPRKQEKQHAS